jgi:xanthine dehydrogenase iron-sulfur cluster and FAD-binding subunit A
VDQNTVSAVLAVRSRDDLAALGPGVAVLAGGSVLFAEPHDDLTTLLDLTTLDWPAVNVDERGLSLAATCPLVEIAALSRAYADVWAAAPLFRQACTALYGSFKVWNVATIGGNLCTALPAGPMTSLAAALDAEVLIWGPDGTDRRMPAASFVTGNTTTDLRPGEVLRSVEIAPDALASRTAYRKIALSPIGRSGAVLIGRRPPAGGFVLTITAGTVRPVQLRYPSVPDARVLQADVEAVDAWFTDAHGAADWRRAVSVVLGLEILEELA